MLTSYFESSTMANGRKAKQSSSQYGFTVSVDKRSKLGRKGANRTHSILRAPMRRHAARASVLRRIRVWAGSNRAALSWYCSEPIPAFGDRTAEALVNEGKAEAVRDYLDHIATGGFA